MNEEAQQLIAQRHQIMRETQSELDRLNAEQKQTEREWDRCMLICDDDGWRTAEAELSRIARLKEEIAERHCTRIGENTEAALKYIRGPLRATRTSLTHRQPPMSPAKEKTSQSR